MQHHKFTVGGFVMISVGIDVAKDKHDCFIISSEGEVLADVFTIPNSMDGFQLSAAKDPRLLRASRQNKSRA
jgi:transposase